MEPKIIESGLLQVGTWNACAQYTDITHFRVVVSDMIRPYLIKDMMGGENVKKFLDKLLSLFITTREYFDINRIRSQLQFVCSQLPKHEYENILVHLYIMCKINQMRYPRVPDSMFALKMMITAHRASITESKTHVLNRIPSEYSQIDPYTVCLIEAL
jgi:hypothetical protein